MATSGSINFNVTRSDIIDHALRLLAIYGEQESVSSEDTALASRALNMMVKSWQAQGLHLWTETEATGILSEGIPSYLISSTAGHFSEIMVETSISADEASGQTVLSVTNTDNISANDYIGIVLDDGSIHWTTVVSTGATTVTVAAAISDDAAAGNRVYSYTYKLARPMHISSVRVRDDADNDIEVQRISRKDYYNIPNKYTTGVPMNWYFDPQLSGGTIHLYPTPQDANLRLKLTFQRGIEDFDSGVDNPDFPTEWCETIAYNLAVRLAPIFSAEEKLMVIAPIAAELLDGLKQWDSEKVSICFSPSIYG